MRVFGGIAKRQVETASSTGYNTSPEMLLIFFLQCFLSFLFSFLVVREGSGGVAGGRGHPDLTGSAKPGMSSAGAPARPWALEGPGPGPPGPAGKADLGKSPLQIPK